MGYYTDYSLDRVGVCNSEDVVLPDLELVKRFFKDGELFELKWYDHFKDMLMVSGLNPDVVFETSGVGEDNGDMWRAIFLSGKYKVVEARIVFDDFKNIDWV